MSSKIRWTRSDYISLGRAVASFNRTVGNLSGKGIVLPDLMNYNELKSGITTRQELNRIIGSLKRFQNPMKQVRVSLNGFEVTRWELEEVRKAKTRATRRLTGELAGIESGAVGTGNTRANEIRATLQSFENFASGDLSSFKRISRSILRQGRSDYEMSKALTFQRNFITAYEKMGRREIVEFAKSFRNPEDFWEAIKNSEFTDLSLRYDVEEGMITIGEMSKDESYYYELNKLLG